MEGRAPRRRVWGREGKARPFLQRRFPSLPQYLLILGGELDDVAVAEVVGGLGAEPGRALHHRIARVHELLGGDEARAVVAADLLKVPLLEADHKVVVLRIPVVEGRDVQAAVKAVELILFVSQFFVGRIRKEDDNYYLTYKSKGLMTREEYNLPLTKESYEHMRPKADGILISKTRYLIPEKDGLTIELDVFDAPYEGLYLAEVEFSSEEQALSYNPPVWFGEDVTNSGKYHNSRLSQGNL